jgi:hypothetical protein
MSSKATFLLSFFLLFLVNSRVSAAVSDFPMSYGEYASSVLADTVFIDQIHLERKQQDLQIVFQFQASKQLTGSTIYLKRIGGDVVLQKNISIQRGANSIALDAKTLQKGNYLLYVDRVISKHGANEFLVTWF